MTVYFIKPVGMQGPIKIGFSKSPDTRLSTLDNWAPFRLEMIASIPGDVKLERQFHARFAGSHERREWFTWSPELQAAIDQINAGAFDVSRLPAPAILTGGARKSPWTPEQRARHSLGAKVRAAEKESGYRLPSGISVYHCLSPGHETARARIEAFIADPVAHGISKSEYRATLADTSAEYHLQAAASHQRLAEQAMQQVAA